MKKLCKTVGCRTISPCVCQGSAESMELLPGIPGWIAHVEAAAVWYRCSLWTGIQRVSEFQTLRQSRREDA